MPIPKPGNAGFEQHASPEAIHEYLAKARNARRELDRSISWLEGLLVRRSRQVAAGQWPPTTDNGEPTS